ncbi:hypothetical protein PP175_15975 [Aneurinibacillus sp. Ricciae_BoGa-3]|uniref:hypothetical protein n=1 Tax=Aneurinibacillus sp. Ricciae_BoGa-3 TaxID=3022697 RepID=UPI00234254C3|nr:hypothetical protein [Aneurinibacillus sp. Ricciae_BoGa-3]WCK52920.1 hypothetical protein PP175_15975 [Aneurinibacillus sp. Ricciae_BoGa-3]
MIHNSLITGLLNQISPGNLTQIELRAGQIIKGTVLKLYPDNHAAVQLGGITVTAKLETPLEIGQKTWLQVQPGAGPVTLKVITRPNEANQASEGTMEGLVKALGIKSTPGNVGLLNKLVQANIALKPENLKSFLQAVGQVGDDAETVNAAIVALRKGLPLTKETLLALRTFSDNKNVGSMVDRLLTDTGSLLQSADMNQSPELKMKFQQFYTNLQNMKSSLVELAASISKGEYAPSTEAGSPDNIHADRGQPQPAQPGTLLADEAANRSSSADRRTIANDLSVHGELAAKQDKEQQILIQKAGRQQQIAGKQEVGGLQETAGSQEVQQQTGAQLASNSNLSARAQDHPIQELFNRMGINYENDAFRGFNGSGSSAESKQIENLKASVLQLLDPADANPIPQQMKEEMQSLVSHITGQQLMMAPDAGSPLIQLMLHVPMPGVHNANAVIQLESRQKGKGSVDPDNCRLFFYLSMDNLGETMLDVSIVNKILSIIIYNNRADVSALIQATRQDLEKELSDKGYKLSSVRVLPVKDEKQEGANFAQKTGYSAGFAGYKGVDFRV